METRRACSVGRPPALRWQLGCVVVLALVPFLPCVVGEAILDDRQYLTLHPVTLGSVPWTEAFTRTLFERESAAPRGPAYWRPAVLLWFRAALAVVGPGAAVHHVLNLLLHAGNSVLLLLLLRRLTGPGSGALFGAVLFAVHPCGTEAVAWISGNTDLLALGGTLTCALAWCNRPWLAAVAWLAALLAKETALPAPLVLAVLFAPTTRWTPSRWLALASALGSYVVLRSLAPLPEAPPELASLGQRLLCMPGTLGRFLLLLLVPYPLAFQRHITVDDPVLIAAVAPFLIALWFLVRCARLRPALCWMLLFLLPVSGPLPIAPMDPGSLPFSDRYLYFPAAGLGLLVALLPTLPPRWWPALLLPCSVAVALHAADFTATERLLGHALRASPRSAALWCTLGEERLLRCLAAPEAEVPAEARAAVAALERSCGLRPAWRQPLRSLAMALLLAGEIRRAERLATSLARSDEHDAIAASYLADILIVQHRSAEARTWLEIALRREPRLDSARHNLAWLARRRAALWLQVGSMARR